MAVGEAIEEQSLPRCHERHYYPAKIGDEFKDHQYLVIAKLGYGAYSTVSLAWDQIVFAETGINTTSRQLGFTRHETISLKSMELPFMADTTASSQNPKARVFVCYRRHLQNAILPKLLVKSIIHRLWFSSNYFIRAAVSSMLNVLMQLEGDNSLKDIKDQEPRDPSDPVITTDGAAPVLPIYQSHLPEIRKDWKARDRASEPHIPKTSFEDFVYTIPPGEEKDQFSQVHTEDTNLGSGSEGQLYKLIQDEWMIKPPSEEDMVGFEEPNRYVTMDDWIVYVPLPSFLRVYLGLCSSSMDTVVAADICSRLDISS
ncbi:uncharacterized protein PADG_03913 [Paracoccidioides brasiliensis Pb18]|uniref:Protein kinase domain-containing protein n=1 Tax=Paracoccidioides brasiliensis (strain Pb18) TaxID=502780 RepID=C1G9H7_PARBD|nr:uncharacterized protein PADG_03913 [Paracoccidioides brasiliensis Pb18]EEH47829.2 hypothetical protein PADG_03913 [Paracoccidioides brasiliensis Pb18]